MKQYETRSWQTNYRGKLVICSAKKTTKQQQQEYSILSKKYQIKIDWDDLPFGSTIAICDLVDCIEMTNDFIQTIPKTERDCGDWQEGRYAWKLENIRVLDNPTPIKGKQGLWNIELDLDISLSSPVEKLLGDKLSIPCLVKQPHKKPFEGLIVGDHGADFDIRVGDQVLQLPKLYIFPNPYQKKCRTDNGISPSKIIPKRRKKGTGSGYIYWRTVEKKDKKYQQTWFCYELWDKGRQIKSCKYIPRKLRSQIEKMNNEKVPVKDILKVLRSKKK